LVLPGLKDPLDRWVPPVRKDLRAFQVPRAFKDRPVNLELVSTSWELSRLRATFPLLPVRETLTRLCQPILFGFTTALTGAMPALFKDRKVLRVFKAQQGPQGQLVPLVLKDRAVLRGPRDRKD
jgi:hypothetical protein